MLHILRISTYKKNWLYSFAGEKFTALLGRSTALLGRRKEKAEALPFSRARSTQQLCCQVEDNIMQHAN